MLCLNKKTEYALAALAYLAERSHRVASAREIAEACDLPLALLMKILKCMQHHGMLLSTRGVRGGYRVVADLDETSLFDLVAMMECPDKPGAECGCMDHAADPMARVELSRSEPAHGPAMALQYKLVRVSEGREAVRPGVARPANRRPRRAAFDRRRHGYTKELRTCPFCSLKRPPPRSRRSSRARTCPRTRRASASASRAAGARASPTCSTSSRTSPPSRTSSSSATASRSSST